LDTSQEVKKTLEEEYQKFQNVGDLIKNEKFSVLNGLKDSYKQMFIHLNIYSRKDLEELFQNFLSNSFVNNLVQQFFDFEKNLNKFLEVLDKDFPNQDSHQISTNQKFPSNFYLQEVLSGKKYPSNNSLFFSSLNDRCIVVLLRHFAWLPWRQHIADLHLIQEELEEQSCSVVIVTFGDRENALKWKEEMKVDFPMFIDAERNFYKTLGFNSSISKSFNTSIYCYYGAALASGKSPPKFVKGDDAFQMAGDMVVTRDGDDVIVSHIHKSQSSDDRPTIPFLMKLLKSLNH